MKWLLILLLCIGCSKQETVNPGQCISEKDYFTVTGSVTGHVTGYYNIHQMGYCFIGYEFDVEDDSFQVKMPKIGFERESYWITISQKRCARGRVYAFYQCGY